MKHRYHYIEVDRTGSVVRNLFFWVGSRERKQLHLLRNREDVYISPSNSESLYFAYIAETQGGVRMLPTTFQNILTKHF